MARRKRHRHQPKPPALHDPSRWRLQHGDFTPPVREADPETGLTVLRRRAIDTLGLMLSRGTIRPAMQAAGEAFRGAFTRRSLQPTPRHTPHPRPSRHPRDAHRAHRHRPRTRRQSHGRLGQPGKPRRLRNLAHGRMRALNPRMGCPPRVGRAPGRPPSSPGHPRGCPGRARAPLPPLTMRQCSDSLTIGHARIA